MVQSIKSARPSKPHPDFPLFPHACGQWAKKVRGKLVYFGPWAHPQAALEKWLEQKDDLLAGRVPREKKSTSEPNLTDLVNSFLNTKKAFLDSGELAPRTFQEYYKVCESLIKEFGAGRLLTDLRPEDFEKVRTKWAAKWGATTLLNEIVRVRTLFKYGLDNGIIAKPILFGQGFKCPSKKSRRLERASKGVRKFEAAEIIRMIDAASQPMKAMIWLGINGGLGNSDVGNMPISALDLNGGWLNYPRPKTGIERRIPLWPETVAAIKDWLARRPAAKDAANESLVFVTKYGLSWSKEKIDNPVSKETRKLLDELGINGNRNFYALRHTFETIGGEAKDQVAVNAIMGHVDESMAGVYREGISDERLKAVTDFVRTWLMLAAKDQAKKAG